LSPFEQDIEMLKFMVVLYKRSDLSQEEFRRHLREIHGPLAQKLPGLRKYVQNYACEDRKRNPGWDAIIELYFEDWDTMEHAWSTAEGKASDADLPLFADLKRTTWSVVEEVTVLG
jgi:uncharacterized protein (TIGR02118 family)